ncbi:MAG TPA: hypothetical protein VMF08_16325 [Candidatus Sulfotelmatobacter sp.]|nr:hypothetical protein [Candidatus Sulfotelmatobacter sp.]
MKINSSIKVPVSVAVPAVLGLFLSIFVLHAAVSATVGRPPQSAPVLTVLRAQRAAALCCCRNGRLLLSPYATRIARIDATACPDDFFQAWEKYVCDIQTLSAINRANEGKAIVSIGVAIFTKNLTPLAGVMPEHPEQMEIARNTAVADWQNVKHIALQHYGIKITPIRYGERRASSV